MTWWLEFAAGIVAAVALGIVYIIFWMPRQQRKAAEATAPPAEASERPDRLEVTEDLLARPEEASTFKRAFFLVIGLAFFIGGPVLLALLGNWFMAGAWPTIVIMSLVYMVIAVRKSRNK